MLTEVLLVEDNPGDVRLMQEACSRIDKTIRLSVVSDGVEALAFLRREGAYMYSPRPRLILLDLNLPKVDGRQVLSHIKKDDSLKLIPTVILTSSELEEDVVNSYQLHANCYLKKPSEFDALTALLEGVKSFWLNDVQTPHDLAA